jgi:hypothetical protein
MMEYLVSVGDGKPYIERRNNMIEVVVVADDPAKAVSEALQYTPPHIKGGVMQITLKPMPVVM